MFVAQKMFVCSCLVVAVASLYVQAVPVPGNVEIYPGRYKIDVFYFKF